MNATAATTHVDALRLELIERAATSMAHTRATLSLRGFTPPVGGWTQADFDSEAAHYFHDAVAEAEAAPLASLALEHAEVSEIEDLLASGALAGSHPAHLTALRLTVRSMRSAERLARNLPADDGIPF